MRRGLGTVVVLASLAASLAACSPSPPPSVLSSSADSDAPSAAAETTVVRAYFYLDGAPGSAGLVPVPRAVAPNDLVSSAMTELLAGPTAWESGERTITSAIPDGSRLLNLSVTDGIAIVDLSPEFQSGGGSTSMFVRLAQVVFTLTQFSSVRSVLFEIEGQPVSVFGGEGIVLDHPQTRADNGEALPTIFVDLPAYGGSIGNPARIGGTADVFEAQFRVTLLDAAGATIADVPAKASCGTGCRGTFDLTLPYTVDRAQTGTLRVWDGSVKDGRPVNVREYPVGLVPAG
jgi:germination protein M